MISNKKSSIAASIGIAISAMLMFSMVQISDCFNLAFKELISSSTHQDFYVIDVSYDNIVDINNRFESMGDDAPDKYMSTMIIGDIYEDGWQAFKLMGFSGDIDYFKKADLISGRYPCNEYEICIEKSYADLHPDLKINDEMTLDLILASDENTAKAKNISKKFMICGIIKDVIDDGTFFYTNIETAKKIFDENNITDSKSNAIIVEALEGGLDIDKMVDAEFEIQSIIASKTEDIKYFNEVQLISNDEKISNYDEKGTFETVSLVIFMLSLIIAVCLAIFVYNTISLSFIRKINVLGTMRCIGLKNNQLVRIVLTEQFLIVTIGAFTGMILGALLNLIIADKLMVMLVTSVVKIKVKQSISTYIVTYLLALTASLIASLKLILKIRKSTPITIKYITNPKKEFSKKSIIFKTKNFLFNLALQNLKRGFSKSIIQAVTLIVSFTLCFVICNTFAVVGGNVSKGAVSFSDYTIMSNIVNCEYFTDDDLRMLESYDGIEAVYTQEILNEYNWGIEKDPLQIMLYDDNLWRKFSKINKIEYDSSSPFSVLVTRVENTEEKITVYKDKEQYSITPIIMNDAQDLNYASVNTGNYLLINEKTAENLNYEKGRYCTFLVDTDKDLSELLDIKFSIDQVFVSSLHEGKDAAEMQLLGMVIIAAYIMAATIILSFMIISNTIKENLKSKKGEYGIMRAMGLNLNQLYTVACYENFILTVIACLIGASVSLIINYFLTLVLFESIKISAVVYILIILLFTVAIEIYSYFNIKKNTSSSIVEMIYER